VDCLRLKAVLPLLLLLLLNTDLKLEQDGLLQYDAQKDVRKPTE